MKRKCGRETEVYSRVVGFYRPTKLWNKGKKEEFKERKTFSLDKVDMNNSKKIKGEDKKLERKAV